MIEILWMSMNDVLTPSNISVGLPIAVAIAIYFSTEVRNLKRIRSEQLLAAITHIYDAWMNMNKWFSVLSVCASSAEDKEDFVRRVLITSSNAKMVDLSSPLSLFMADKILSVHKDVNLYRALIYLYQFQDEIIALDKSLREGNEDGSWTNQADRIQEIKFKFDEALPMLKYMFNSDISP